MGWIHSDKHMKTKLVKNKTTIKSDKNRRYVYIMEDRDKKKLNHYIPYRKGTDNT